MFLQIGVRRGAQHAKRACRKKAHWACGAVQNSCEPHLCWLRANGAGWRSGASELRLAR